MCVCVGTGWQDHHRARTRDGGTTNDDQGDSEVVYCSILVRRSYAGKPISLLVVFL